MRQRRRAARRPQPPQSATGDGRRSIDANPLSILGIREPDLPDVFKPTFTRVPDLHGEHVVSTRELEQRRLPVDRSPEVRHHHDESPLASDRGDGLERPGQLGRDTAAHFAVLQREQHADEPCPPLPRRQRQCRTGTVRDHPDSIPSHARGVTQRDRDAQRDVVLAPLGRPERHRRRPIEDDPRHEHPFREMNAHVRDTRPGCDVPVHQAHVVAGDVRAYLGQLAPAAEDRGPVVARELAVHPAADRELEGAQKRVRHLSRAGALRRRLDAECPQSAHAAIGLPSSSGGAGTCWSTASRTSSAVRSSASAR